MRFKILADQQQAARLLVQPVNYPRPGQLLKRWHPVQKAIHQSATRISSAWMHYQAGRFIDDEQIFVLKDEIQIQWLRLADNRNLCLWLQHNTFTATNGIARPHFSLIDGDEALQNPALQATAGELRKHLGQRLVQSLTGKFHGYCF